jgi:Holliday junction DNA helicase RuvB
VREEFLDPGIGPDPVEEELEQGLRPRALQEFIGQSELKDHLSVVLEAALGCGGRAPAEVAR